jgi:hypothetical protein
MSKRGRPISINPEDQPTKFTREITHSDGVKQFWTYDLEKHLNGPIKVEITYPTHYSTFEEEQEQIPLLKRRYLNPNTAKWVGYYRAVALGLVEKKTNKL